MRVKNCRSDSLNTYHRGVCRLGLPLERKTVGIIGLANKATDFGDNDDGVGFDQDKVMTFSKNKGPLGILIMRERTEQLDGDFTLETQIGKGTHVLVEIPL